MSKLNLANYLKANLSPEDLAKLKNKYLKSAGYDRFQDHPALFAQEILGLHLWSKQQEILQALAQPRARVSVRSCHGIGKTLTSSAAALWFLHSYKPSRVVTTATKQDQLKLGIWYEINRLHSANGLSGNCDTLKFNLSLDQIALGQTARDSTSFQGQHCEHILVIVDESAGVSEEIFIGVQALLTSEDARLLLIGNPTSSSGTFYDSHHSLRHLYSTIGISAFETPAWTGEAIPEHVRKALINPAWVTEKTEEWGEDSPLYHSRILGKFPTQASGALVDLLWITAAQDRPLAPALDGVGIEFGVDVARYGECETVVYIRQGPNILAMEAWQGQATTYTAGRVIDLAKKYHPEIIRVDDGGVGGGPVDMLREANAPVQAVLAGARASKPDSYVMLRDELWWNTRERLRTDEINGLTDSITQAQLSAVTYTYDSRGRIKVEGKDGMRKRGLKSPDRADALNLAFHTSGNNFAAPITQYEPDFEW